MDSKLSKIDPSHVVVSLLFNSSSGGALTSSRLDTYPTNKFLQIRRFRLRQQNANTRQLPQTQSGVSWKSGPGKGGVVRLLRIGSQLRRGARGIL
jgi:hypothetical protein